MATATFWFTQIMTLPVFHAFCYITQTIEALSLITYFFYYYKHNKRLKMVCNLTSTNTQGKNEHSNSDVATELNEYSTTSKFVLTQIINVITLGADIQIYIS